MSTQDSMSVVRQFIERAWIGKEVDAALDFYAPEFIYHNPAMKGMPPGLDGIRALLSGFHAAFPDADYRIDALVGESEMVGVLYSWRGTNRGRTRSDARHSPNRLRLGSDLLPGRRWSDRRAMGHR